MLSPFQPEMGTKGICAQRQQRMSNTARAKQQRARQETHQPLGDLLSGLVLLEDGVADLGQELADLLLDLLIALLGVVGRLVVHLVDADDHLLHTQREGEQSVLAGLAGLGIAGLELALARSDHQDGDVGLRGT
jgi:hypothetical protein